MDKRLFLEDLTELINTLEVMVGSSWGPCHIVIADDNLDDSSIDWCLNHLNDPDCANRYSIVARMVSGVVLNCLKLLTLEEREEYSLMWSGTFLTKFDNPTDGSVQCPANVVTSP